MDLGSALVSLLIAMVIKIFVMIIATRLVLILMGAIRSKNYLKTEITLEPSEVFEIKILFYSLLLFWISELVCGIEMYIILRTHYLLKIIHVFSSAFGMGLFLIGIFLIFDKRTLHIFHQNKPCFATSICKACTYRQGDKCSLELMYKFMLVMLFIATIPIFFASTEVQFADLAKYKLPFDSLNNYYDTVIIPFIQKIYPDYRPGGRELYVPYAQVLSEYRIIPVLTIILCLSAGILLYLKRFLYSICTALFAVGIIFFSYFQMLTNYLTQDSLLGALMHEITELWFLLLTIEILKKLYGYRSTKILEKSLAKESINPI